MAGIGWFCWFSFSLGLAILGVETGRPGQLVAAGMVGYGVGSLAGSVAASLLVTRLPRVPVMVSGWLVLGTTLVLLPGLAGSLLALAVASAVGGFAMPLGIAALNALITEHTRGADRRTAFAVQHVAINGGSSRDALRRRDHRPARRRDHHASRRRSSRSLCRFSCSCGRARHQDVPRADGLRRGLKSRRRGEQTTEVWPFRGAEEHGQCAGRKGTASADKRQVQ